jgi:hypothetical protein
MPFVFVTPVLFGNSGLEKYSYYWARLSNYTVIDLLIVIFF